MELLTIGVFATTSGLTAKALRLYDAMGLLTPAAVDPESGYRLYDPRQLERARLIGRLRRIGMPLAEIRAVCDLDATESAVRITAFQQRLSAEATDRARAAYLLVDELTGGDTMTDHPEPLSFDAAARCDTGAVRLTNEDRVNADSRLVAVADGGQGPGGSAASAAAIAAVTGIEPGPISAPEVLARLTGLAHEADAAMRDLADDQHEPISTLTGIVLVGSQIAIVHVGDSRAYLLRTGELTQLTRDHSYVQDLVEAGQLSAEDAASHPRRALLVRALGAGAGPVEADLALRNAVVGDRYLLCTDGVSAVLGRGEILTALQHSATPRQAVDRLVELAFEHGAPDNLACAVADVVRRGFTAR